jgi:hypothetical protein
VGTTIIKREQRAVTVVQDEDEPRRLARGSEPILPKERATRAMHKDELLGLIHEAGGDPVIEVKRAATAPPVVEEPAVIVDEIEPAAVVVDTPSAELVANERPTCAIDPDALRKLVSAPVYPTYHPPVRRWPLLVASLAFAIAALLLAYP